MQNLRIDSSGRLHEIGEGHGDVDHSQGVYAISPGGNLVLVPNIPLKDGWRYATHDDIDAALQRKDDIERAKLAPKSPDVASEPHAAAHEPPHDPPPA